MISTIKQRTTVSKGGRVEISSPELHEGEHVEVIVLLEQDTTEYLLSNEANRTHLLQAIEDLEKKEKPLREVGKVLAYE